MKKHQASNKKNDAGIKPGQHTKLYLNALTAALEWEEKRRENSIEVDQNSMVCLCLCVREIQTERNGCKRKRDNMNTVL